MRNVKVEKSDMTAEEEAQKQAGAVLNVTLRNVGRASDVPNISRDKGTLGYKISLINVVLGGHVRNIYTSVEECSTGKMHAFSYRGVQRGSNAGVLLE